MLEQVYQNERREENALKQESSNLKRNATGYFLQINFSDPLRVYGPSGSIRQFDVNNDNRHKDVAESSA